MFNQKRTLNTRKTDTVTHEGGDSFTYENPRNELIGAVATTFLDDKFYESGKDRIARVTGLMDKILAEGDDEFLFKLAYTVRDEWNMRSVSQLMIGHLLEKRALTSEYSDWVASTWVRPDDMLNSVQYFLEKNGGKGKFPKALKRAVNKKLNRMSYFHFSKYLSNANKRQLNFRDLIRITHPTPKDEKQAELFKSIVKETMTGKANWRKDVSTASKEETKAVWEKAISKMGVFGVLNNLNNFEKHGISAEKKAEVIALLRNPEAIAGSRLLPFRFITAIENVKDRQYREALIDALHLAVSNVQLPQGRRILVAVDTSASMRGEPIKHGSLFGAILYNAGRNSNCDVDLVSFDTGLYEHDAFDMGTYALSQKLKATGGGTYGHLVFQYAESKKVPYDYIFILTDMQYQSLNRGRGYYGTRVDPSAKTQVINVNLQGYGRTVTPFDPSQKVYELSGISEKIFDYLEVVGDTDGVIKAIKQKKLAQ